MRVLVTGSRDWADLAEIQLALGRIHRATDGKATLVHGACPTGADQIASATAGAWGWTIEAHPADWKHAGRRAGPARNRHMVNLGADVCLAFIKNGSNGATGCAKMAEDAGIPTLRWFA